MERLTLSSGGRHQILRFGGMFRAGFNVNGHGLLVTVKKLRAEKAITPNLQGEILAWRFLESTFGKEFRSYGESENGLQVTVFSLAQ